MLASKRVALSERVNEALRYLGLRGLIEWHPNGAWVRVREEQEATC